jgi:plasmid stabilization system protein ParE
MKYEVLVTDRAKRQMDGACRWYEENAPHVAADWYNGLLDALLTLEVNPLRYGIARESDPFPVEIRQLLYGVGKQKTHRALFSVHGDRVVVRAVRHVKQRDVELDDI